jgi:hypothetical protein
MKYLVSWTVKESSYGSVAEAEAGATRILNVVAKWSPPETWVIHQFLGRIDGMGGYAVIETDDPESIARTTANFGIYVDYTVHPCIEFDRGVELLTEAAAFRESVS